MLQEKGFKAFVVGARCATLIGQPPKDYDVATSATPEEVRAAFRRSRIIGRRFKIVMRDERSGDDRGLHLPRQPGRRAPTPTSTAACCATTSSATSRGRRHPARLHGQRAVLRPGTETIVDYHHGVADIQQKTLRMIGDPRTRYREDRYACCARCDWRPSSA